ncbi:MAG: DUF169 domain-containing protein [Prolixibacteraceae bacterium]|nr:DUF169 domain-containing protein [Prolixibacteraceae bacterium]
MIEAVKNILGPKSTAINVNGEITDFMYVPSKQMRFCEAVNHSFNIPIRLTNDNLGCPGTRRSVGFDKEDGQLAFTISENNRIPEQFIAGVLERIPTLNDIKCINLGLTDYMEKFIHPDLYIAYVNPDKVMAIMQKLAKQKIISSIPPFSLLSVCGNVFSNCYKNKIASISFGCPESRIHGGIAGNEVVLGIPYEIAELLTKI